MREVGIVASPNLEIRSAPNGGPGILSGWAVVYDEPSVDLGGFVEVVRRGAFTESLKENPDVSARVQHKGGLTTIGRTTNDTLRLRDEEKGLHYEVSLPNTTAGRDIAELVRAGYIDKSSFGFVPRAGGVRWDYGSVPQVRELTNLDIHDVSPVDGPAYKQATVEMRSARLFQVKKTEIDAKTQRCWATHMGKWLIEPMWFRGAVASIQSGAVHTNEVTGEDEQVLYELTEEGVAIVPIQGQTMKKDSKFGGTSTIRVQKALRKAVQSEEAKSILLHIDSPGGTVSGTEELATVIAKVNTQKPVVAHIDNMGASAALWIASQAQRMTANPTASIGSIGVIAIVEDISGAMDKAGVKVHVVSTGKFKGAFAPGAPIKKEHLTDLQRELDELHELFVDAIAEGRDMARDAVSELADGRTHIASQAQSFGLIDAVQSLDDTLAEMDVKKASKRSLIYDTALAPSGETRATSLQDSRARNEEMLAWNRESKARAEIAALSESG